MNISELLSNYNGQPAPKVSQPEPSVSRQSIFDLTAGDDSPAALVAAERNNAVRRAGWCACNGLHGEAYFMAPTGTHGWLCLACRRITQLG